MIWILISLLVTLLFNILNYWDTARYYKHKNIKFTAKTVFNDIKDYIIWSFIPVGNIIFMVILIDRMKWTQKLINKKN